MAPHWHVLMSGELEQRSRPVTYGAQADLAKHSSSAVGFKVWANASIGANSPNKTRRAYIMMSLGLEVVNSLSYREL